MSGAVRILLKCFPPFLYYNRLPHGTDWFGHGPSFMQSLSLPEYTIISNNSMAKYDELTALLSNQADIYLVVFAIAWEIYQSVDFTAPWSSTETYIMSVKETRIKGSIFKDIFDSRSYIMIGLCLISLTTLLLMALPGV